MLTETEGLNRADALNRGDARGTPGETVSAVMRSKIQKMPVFKKSPTHWIFRVLLGFGLYRIFPIYLFEPAIGKLVG